VRSAKPEGVLRVGHHIVWVSEKKIKKIPEYFYGKFSARKMLARPISFEIFSKKIRTRWKIIFENFSERSAPMNEKFCTQIPANT